MSVQLVMEHLRFFSALCHAAGGPSGVPLLADSGWLLYSCGDGFAWGWGLSCNSCPVPPLFFFFVPALLPLRGSAPLLSGLACLSPACWSTPRIGWRGLAATFYLRVGVLLTKVSPEFVGYEGGLGCPSWFVILFLCLLVLHLFLELGWFLVTRWWLLLRLLVLVSSDARLHLPAALASSSTPISGSWLVQAPAFSWALPWVLPSRFPC